MSEIFRDEPEHWGLRGDPLLWSSLKEQYSAVLLPYPEELLEREIIAAYKRFAGELPERGRYHNVPKFSGSGGGMSMGMLSGGFWLDTAIPLLLERLKEIDRQCTRSKNER